MILQRIKSFEIWVLYRVALPLACLSSCPDLLRDRAKY